jgi:hypothetical protein
VLCLPRQKFLSGSACLHSLFIARSFPFKNSTLSFPPLKKKRAEKISFETSKSGRREANVNALILGLHKSDKLCNKEAGFVVDEYLKLCDLGVCLRVGAAERNEKDEN